MQGYKETIEETVWAPKVYFTFSIVNFVEMVIGVALGWISIIRKRENSFNQ